MLLFYSYNYYLKKHVLLYLLNFSQSFPLIYFNIFSFFIYLFLQLIIHFYLHFLFHFNFFNFVLFFNTSFSLIFIYLLSFKLKNILKLKKLKKINIYLFYLNLFFKFKINILKYIN